MDCGAGSVVKWLKKKRKSSMAAPAWCHTAAKHLRVTKETASGASRPICGTTMLAVTLCLCYASSQIGQFAQLAKQLREDLIPESEDFIMARPAIFHATLPGARIMIAVGGQIGRAHV